MPLNRNSVTRGDYFSSSRVVERHMFGGVEKTVTDFESQ